MNRSPHKVIGLITIGQSPRTDVVSDMKPFFGDHVEIIEMGALDGLSIEQVQELKPEGSMIHLVTRMRDGTEVVIGKEKILPRIQQCIGDLNRRKVNLIMLLCVGKFPEFLSSCLVIEPQCVVDRFIESIIKPKHHLGVIIPLIEQESWVRDTFLAVTPNLTIISASPYSDPSSISKAGQNLKDAGCDLILMYCMGFNLRNATEVRSVANLPVVLSNTIVARSTGELLV
ncbi:MAG: AroM family protein [Calditrichaeota bacterium]|jgi:protein AroM|nr:AroM family protein [Calditrichota bacterium]